MATIADELLNDFEDSGSEHGDDLRNSSLLDNDNAGLADDHASANTRQLGIELDGDEEDDGDDPELMNQTAVDEREDAEETKARVEKMELHSVSDVRSVAGLMKQLEPVLEKIEHYKKTAQANGKIEYPGNIEDNPEYKLLTQSNTLSTSIDGEIILVHKFLRDHYSIRFPELENLIQNPLDYAKTVAIIGNGPMEDIRALSESRDNIARQSLRQVLDGPSLMVVTVEATYTRGTSLSPEQHETVRRAAKMMIELDIAKKTLTDFVQSRMAQFAPNLTALIGSLTAAQLLNYAGGISGLANTAACNIPPLGSKKSARSVGLATNTGVRHQGFLFQNDIIRQVPSDLKVQAMRILSAKVVLAARIDQVHSSPDGSQGLALGEQVDKRISKLSEAPPNKGVRALPAPDDKPARKRGGRQARKAKEATAMTDLRRAQNRMAFGKEEAETGYGIGDSPVGLGMIGQTDTGRIRTQQIDQRTRAKLSKKNAGWGGTTTAVGGTATSMRSLQSLGNNTAAMKAAGLRTSGVGMLGGMRTNVGNPNSGTTSTIAFTPVQGLELIDPKVREEMNRKRKADEDRWFKSGTFTNVGNDATPKVDAGGFKVPSLPIKRQKQGG